LLVGVAAMSAPQDVLRMSEGIYLWQAPQWFLEMVISGQDLNWKNTGFVWAISFGGREVWGSLNSKAFTQLTQITWVWALLLAIYCGILPASHTIRKIRTKPFTQVTSFTQFINPSPFFQNQSHKTGIFLLLLIGWDVFHNSYNAISSYNE
jgi:hypothetical protein